MDRGDQMSFHSGLCNESLSTLFETCLDVLFAVVDRQKYELGRRPGLNEFVDRLDTGHSRHGYIHNNNVWIETLDLRHQEGPIIRRANEIKVGSQ